MEKILVTGSSGMIGTRLCEKLLEQGIDIVGVDKVSNAWNETINQKTIICDLNQPDALSKLPSDVDMVIHLAANARVYDLVLRPELAFDNTRMTHHLLEFCRKNHVHRFVFSSSREVYGNSGKSVYTEDEVNVTQTESPYASSKFASESLIWSYHHCFDFNVVIVRFSNVYGMYDKSNRLIPVVFDAIAKGDPIHVFGKTKALDFTYIDDAVDGVLRIVTRFDSAKNNTYNLAFGQAVSIFDVVQKMIRKMNASNKIIVSDSRPGEVQSFCADLTRARQKLGFVPRTDIDHGLDKTLNWYRTHTDRV